MVHFMKKVLIIAFSFNKNVVGSVRSRGLARYLPKYGWEPTILTNKTPGGSDLNRDFSPNLKIIETEYEDLFEKWKRGLHLKPDQTVQSQLGAAQSKDRNHFLDFSLKVWRELFAYPDVKKNWFKPALKNGDEILSNDDFDAIISSSSPVTSHLVARKLKKKWNVPWIADLRDLWTQNHFYSYSRFRKKIDLKLEKKTLAKADAITTVSPPFAEDLAKLHDTPVLVIPNGFDPQRENKNQNPDQKKFTIVYTGQIYQKEMDIETFLESVREFLDSGMVSKNDLRIDLHTPQYQWLVDLVHEYDLNESVEISGWIPQDEITDKQQKAQLLLLLRWNSSQQRGVCPAKVFEYLAAKRPIISLGHYDGSVTDLINKTHAGFNLKTTNQLKKLLIQLYQEFESNKEIKYQGIDHEINKYSHLNMARKFGKVLEKISK